MNNSCFFDASESTQNYPQKIKSRQQTRQRSDHFLSVSQAAKRFDIPERTIRHWCESGKLAALPKAYGKKTTYQITVQALEMALEEYNQVRVVQKRSSKPFSVCHGDSVEGWKVAMATGLMTGKPFSPFTQSYYAYYVDGFIKKYSRLSLDTLKMELAFIPTHQFGRKDKFFKALMSFAKFLIRENGLSSSFLEDAKPLKPKRHLPPRKFTVDEQGLEKLLKACDTAMERVMITLLASTGLRASECCSLLRDDIDLENGALTVRIGKGGKTRRVGLTISMREGLQSYISTHSHLERSDAPMFIDKKGQQLHRDGLYQRLQRIGNVAGVKVSPHALRRAFVTINANKGRPLQMLQIACGHGDIKTTMGYCLTSQQEVVRAMQDWM